MKPEIKQLGGLFVFHWDEISISITVSRPVQDRSGGISGELHIKRSGTGCEGEQHIYRARLNFVAPRSKDGLIKTLKEQDEATPWAQIIEQLSHYFLESFRQGEPVIEVGSEDDEAMPTKYLVHPVLPEYHPTILFGDPGTGKSLFGSILGIAALMPWRDNPLGFAVNGHSVNVLYLDWESDENELRWRLKALGQGLGVSPISFFYRRCSLPLADDIDEVQKHVLEHDIGIVIIDSLGPACGGELKDAPPALRLYAAIRQLHVTPVIIAHGTKERDDYKSSAYGSVFFTALSRSVWNVKKVQEVGEDEYVMGMFHRKSNVSKLFPPMGFRIKYTSDGMITVAKAVLAGVKGLDRELPIPIRVKAALQHGKMTLKDLAEELQVGEGTLRVTLDRMCKKQEVQKFEDGYGLKARLV